MSFQRKNAKPNKRFNKKPAKTDDDHDTSSSETIVDTSDDEGEDDDEDVEESGEEGELSYDEHEYRKMLNKMFPSKFMNKKVKAGEALKQSLRKKAKKGANKKASKKPSSSKNANKGKNKHRDESEDTEDDSDNDDEEEESVYEDVDSDEESDEEDEMIQPNKNYILLTIENGLESLNSNDDSDYVPSDEETEDEDVEVSTDEDTDDKKTTDRENETETATDEDERKPKRSRQSRGDSAMRTRAGKKYRRTEDDKPAKKKTIKPETISSYDPETVNKTLEQLKQLHANNPDDKIITNLIAKYESDIEKEQRKREKKEKKQKAKNARIFNKIMRDKNTTNDFEFYKKLDLEHQKRIIKEMREINKISRIETPYSISLLDANMPTKLKAIAMKKINLLKMMDPNAGEYYKIKNWVDHFMKIPFGKYNDLPITISDGVEKCHDFMEAAKNTLDNAVYGLNDAKLQILQMLGQLITNPTSIGTAIAIHGPPGTGKTSLVKEGISKILNRPFAFIALGGASDSCFLEGYGYTYEGSTYGKIVQTLIHSQCMNPVFYFDELDKISDTPRGEEIAGILTHLTDTTQNSQFHDKYFSEVDFDLSKCLFIFSYNDETKINPILKDRMYRIKTTGYSEKDKAIICNKYLLPKIRDQVKFNVEDIIIPDKSLKYIIENYCNKEDGVRNLKRCLEIIYTKLNLYRLMKPGINLFENDISLKVEFPFNVTNDIIDKLIKKDDQYYVSKALYGMYH
jgi:ATP-dependent Lon protease